MVALTRRVCGALLCVLTTLVASGCASTQEEMTVKQQAEQVIDSAAEGLKAGTGFVVDKTKEGAGFVGEKAKQGSKKALDATGELIDKAKEGLEEDTEASQ